MISLGMVDVDEDTVLAEAREWDLERGGESAPGNSAVAGIFLEAAVDGLMSCAGDGCRLIETDWMAEASSVAGLFAITTTGKEGIVKTTERDGDRRDSRSGCPREESRSSWRNPGR